MCVCRHSFSPDYCNFTLVGRDREELKNSETRREDVEDKINGDDREEARSNKKDKNDKDNRHTKNT